MNITSLKSTRPAGGPIGNSDVFRAKWDRIVQRSVRYFYVGPTKSGDVKNGSPGNSDQAIFGNPVLRTAKPTVSIGAGAMSGIVNRSVLSGRTCDIAPPIPNLWVDDGVIWQLPSLLVGFTNHSSATGFFSSVKGLGLTPAPASWYQGTPFSASDFPILTDVVDWTVSTPLKKPDAEGDKWSVTFWQATHLLMWARLGALPNAKMFMSMSPAAPFQPVNGKASSAHPIFPAAELQSFSASSPNGTKTFQAQYVMYVPGDIKNVSSTAGVMYDMNQFCWTQTPANQGGNVSPYYNDDAPAGSGNGW